MLRGEEADHHADRGDDQGGEEKQPADHAQFELFEVEFGGPIGDFAIKRVGEVLRALLREAKPPHEGFPDGGPGDVDVGELGHGDAPVFRRGSGSSADRGDDQAGGEAGGGRSSG